MTIPLITTTVSALPTGPQRMGAVDPATFIAASDAWNTAVEDNLQPELAAVVTEINATVEGINAAAEAIATSESTAVGAAATAAATAHYKGAWSTLTGALATPASVSHGGQMWALTDSLADVTTAQPGVDARWLPLGGLNPADALLYSLIWS